MYNIIIILLCRVHIVHEYLRDKRVSREIAVTRRGRGRVYSRSCDDACNGTWQDVYVYEIHAAAPKLKRRVPAVALQLLWWFLVTIFIYFCLLFPAHGNSRKPYVIRATK